MNFHEFIGQVQNRAHMATTGEAVSAIRATLQTLGERLYGGEAGNLAAQLPEEIGAYLKMGDGSENFSLNEFFNRVTKREKVDPPDAVYHARVVLEIVGEAVTPGELNNVRAQLPGEYDPLFEAGSKGQMDTA